MTTTTEQDTKPYGRCITCGDALQTPDDAREHMSQTLAAARAADPQAASVSGHSVSIVNATPEEVEARRVRGIVGSATEDALNRACERLDDEVRRGRITEAQVTEELRWFSDFSDAWTDWLANG